MEDLFQRLTQQSWVFILTGKNHACHELQNPSYLVPVFSLIFEYMWTHVRISKFLVGFTRGLIA
jgi:hypothetical protein